MSARAPVPSRTRKVGITQREANAHHFATIAHALAAINQNNTSNSSGSTTGSGIHHHKGRPKRKP